MQKFSLILFIIVFIYGCERPEKPIKPFDRGGIITNTANMGNTYNDHIFFNLDSNKIVKTIKRMDWDIAFDCRNDKHIILLNNGRGVYASATGKTNFSDVKDTIGLKFLWGQPDLNLDSLAMGQWWLKPSEIFIINLGRDNFGFPLGFIKCIPELQPDKSLKIMWCKLDENTPKAFIIKKNNQYNFNYFSFLKDELADIEPPKDSWDLWFTQYVKLVYSDDFKITQNYQLAGVLVNHNRIEVAHDFTTPYKDIDSNKLASYNFLKIRDGIGYEWKAFNFDTNSYSVNSQLNYIIKVSDGFYYKLHFLDFYNDLGAKGYPKFEYQKL
jgi:hypothetical protein